MSRWILDKEPNRDLRSIKYSVDSYKDMLVDGKLDRLTRKELKDFTIDRLDYISRVVDLELQNRTKGGN